MGDRSKKWWENSYIQVIALIAAVLGIIGFNAAPGNIQNIIDAPNSINTIGQTGNNLIVTNTERTLSDTQTISLKNELSKNPGRIAFKSKIFDPEAKKYTDLLTSVFKSASWNVVTPLATDLLDDFDGKINAFMTGSKSSSSVEISHELTIPVFDESKIPYVSIPPRPGSFGGGLEENTLYLEVGSKQ